MRNESRNGPRSRRLLKGRGGKTGDAASCEVVVIRTERKGRSSLWYGPRRKRRLLFEASSSTGGGGRFMSPAICYTCIFPSGAEHCRHSLLEGGSRIARDATRGVVEAGAQ